MFCKDLTIYKMLPAASVVVTTGLLQAMQVAESIHSVLGAGGFFLTLGWLHQTLDTEDGTWAHLGAF